MCKSCLWVVTAAILAHSWNDNRWPDCLDPRTLFGAIVAAFWAQKLSLVVKSYIDFEQQQHSRPHGHNKNTHSIKPGKDHSISVSPLSALIQATFLTHCDMCVLGRSTHNNKVESTWISLSLWCIGCKYSWMFVHKWVSSGTFSAVIDAWDVLIGNGRAAPQYFKSLDAPFKAYCNDCLQDCCHVGPHLA